MKKIGLISCFFLIIFGLCKIDGVLFHPKEQPDHFFCKGSFDSSYGLNNVGNMALLATRFKSFEAFKKVVKVEYYLSSTNFLTECSNNDKVKLVHSSCGVLISSELEGGVTENDLAEAKNGTWVNKLKVLIKTPYAVSHRMDLKKIHSLARWMPYKFGEGDVAFYNLAKESAKNINTGDLAYITRRDSSEKGYINTFNHFTAQAFITSLFSEQIADYVADLHERYTMPELINGNFSDKQLKDSLNNPIDNYTDMINNEWGQEFGKKLKQKYGITKKTYWTNQLLTNYLNDIQKYYSWAFQIGFKPFRPTDQVIVRFTNKLNVVMKTQRVNNLISYFVD